MEGLTVVDERTVETPFGAPSDPYVIGEIDGVGVAFLARHGRGHRFTPTEVNYRANIYGFKLLGVHTILSASAVGSMKEEYAPDRHRLPASVHRPHAPSRRHVLRQRHRRPRAVRRSDLRRPCRSSWATAAREAGAKVHVGGTYVCMEGPQFSTRAESQLYRTWGADVIGMTNLTEAKLAREAEICYATMALVTDYDCWHPEHDDVDIAQILGYLRANAAMAQTILRNSIKPAAARDARAARAPTRCSSRSSPTARAIPPTDRKHDLAPLLGKYIS